jgi:hypothetical protein
LSEIDYIYEVDNIRWQPVNCLHFFAKKMTEEMRQMLTDDLED